MMNSRPDKLVFLRHVSLLSLCGFLGQAINAASSFAIARLYSAEDFGVYSLGAVVFMVAGAVACSRFDMALLIPASGQELDDLFALSLLMPIGAAGATQLLWSPVISKLLLPGNSTMLASWGWHIGGIVLFAGWYAALTAWCVRDRQYARLAVASIALYGLIALLKTALPFAGSGGASGLFLGQLVGQAGATVGLGLVVAASYRSGCRRRWRLLERAKGVVQQARRHWRFALFGVPQLLVDTLSVLLLLPFIGWYQDAYTVGLFALARAVSDLPTRPIFSALEQVFHERAAKADDPTELVRLVSRVAVAILFIGSPALIFMQFHASKVFTLAFGTEWSDAGSYAAVLSFNTFAYLLTSWTGKLFELRRKHAYSAGLSAVGALTSIVGLALLLHYTGDPLLACWWYSMSGVAFCMVRGGIALRVAGVPLSVVAWGPPLWLVNCAVWILVAQLTERSHSPMLLFAIIMSAFWLAATVASIIRFRGPPVRWPRFFPAGTSRHPSRD